MADAAPQLRIGDQAQPARDPRFLTDDDLDRRLSQVENGLHHFEALLPAMTREIAIIRGHLKRPS